MLIEVRDLKKYFSTGTFRKKLIYAVDGVSFGIRKAESLGLVGESGCGKSTLGRLLVGLIKPTEGEILFGGENIFSLGGEKLRKMQMIFQNPETSLNPRWRIKKSLTEPLRIVGKEEDEIYKLLEAVNLNEELLNRYPWELSGGQLQRIVIARILAIEPEFIVADEPTSSLDLSIQAQILNLMKRLKDSMGLTYLFISHDLDVVRNMCDRIMVMYLGKIVEIASREEIFSNPLHPYTKALLSASFSLDSTGKRIILHGEIPSPLSPPLACRFRTRCPFATEICRSVEPKLIKYNKEHYVACHLLNNM